ncbi:glycoside hydrolase family 31 protein [Schizophyllum amplum]|uniref:beta-glucosidase n=1 Tax=Schizophyllum amplum TaxID=97359 RepID=A0A550BWV0_9AGAR|nr:glycoside hydrolase family 31 protein [Auriculariopsis ampla]
MSRSQTRLSHAMRCPRLSSRAQRSRKAPVQDTAEIQFNYTESPFSFSIFRTNTSEVLFSTASHPIIFEDQYLRLQTTLPENANIYGLGEHTNSFRLDNHNTTLTMFNRDAYGVPNTTNLYGSHPIYQEHRETGTHGVLLLNSNGMDIKLNQTDGEASTLEYNVVGGILDLYFFSGSETDPAAVARQYAELVGLPVEMPYWGYGLHNCRYGYTDFVDVADVIVNYSVAGIPLETMWTDIDYMYKRQTFSLDPDYFPLDRMQEVIDYLHAHEQQYILMTDPAVAYAPNSSYEAYDRGVEMDVFLKGDNGSDFLGLVWPGVTVYPDWFNAKAQEYWTYMYSKFYDPETGLDIDGAWIDMNEPASVSKNYLGLIDADSCFRLPPNRTTSAPDHDAVIFDNATVSRREKRDIMNPPYSIDNAAGSLSSKTAFMNSVHANGLLEYNTHNLFGAMMNNATRQAMLARRPGLRPLIITRSTFVGSGALVGKWLGDNLSTWVHYRNSIAGILGMASVYQVPMVGADICGFGGNTTETLCARWAMLGAFYPFMRNPGVLPVGHGTEAAKNAIDTRYRLLDYIYTAMHKQHVDGTPLIHPLWHAYPKDVNTYPIDTQFLFGPSIMNSTTVTAYLPDDVLYDWSTLTVVQGQGMNVTLNASFTEIPVHIRGGAVLPVRVSSAMTTAELRRQDFELIVAPGQDGTASGSLYVDDGVSVEQDATTEVEFGYADGTLTVDGKFDYDVGVQVARVRVLGVGQEPCAVTLDGETWTA